VTELYLNSSIDDVSGVGPKVKIQLEKLGIESVQDALFFLPKSYENRTKITQIKTRKTTKKVLDLKIIVWKFSNKMVGK